MTWIPDVTGGEDAPALLYHRTSRKAWKKIRDRGLRPCPPLIHAALDLSATEPDRGVYLTRHLASPAPTRGSMTGVCSWKWT